jgi:hypothetical protein
MGNNPRDNTTSLRAIKVPGTSTHSTNANVGRRSNNGSSSTGSDNACWVFEDPRSTRYCVLTSRGVENIANHKYAPGHYTHLDNLMNPIWVFLTERLIPLWMAPNMVTSLGGLHCVLSYFVVRYFSRDYDEPVPDWVILLCAYCSFSCYTLDCMDGKQARRTHQSSPLGQLFDHGKFTQVLFYLIIFLQPFVLPCASILVESFFLFAHDIIKNLSIHLIRNGLCIQYIAYK